MEFTPYWPERPEPLSSNIETVIIYKTASCGFTGDTDNKNGRWVGVIYKNGWRIDIAYNAN